MDDGAVTTWLAAEAEDRFEDGPVGLYELLWWLNGSQFELSAAHARAIAHRFAANWVATGVAELRVIRWPSYDLVPGHLPMSVLDLDDSWREGSEFVALVPTGELVA